MTSEHYNRPVNWLVNGILYAFEPVSDNARVAELVDALVLGTSGVTRESSSLSFRTIIYHKDYCN